MTPGELLAWNIHKAAAHHPRDPPRRRHLGLERHVRPVPQRRGPFLPGQRLPERLLEGAGQGHRHRQLERRRLGKNCQFFADLGLRQVLSGYYDGDEDGSGIAKWIANAKGLPGVVGAMYTTWNDNYGPMDVWAQKAWGSQRLLRRRPRK